jgi:hypothetical protein
MEVARDADISRKSHALAAEEDFVEGLMGQLKRFTSLLRDTERLSRRCRPRDDTEKERKKVSDSDSYSRPSSEPEVRMDLRYMPNNV